MDQNTPPTAPRTPKIPLDSELTLPSRVLTPPAEKDNGNGVFAEPAPEMMTGFQQSDSALKQAPTQVEQMMRRPAINAIAERVAAAAPRTLSAFGPLRGGGGMGVSMFRRPGKLAANAGTLRSDDELDRFLSTQAAQAQAVEAQTSALAATAPRQTATLNNLYAFHKTTLQPLLTKGLALKYQQVILQRDHLTLMETMGVMLEQKLEAIKRNTGKPDESKTSLFGEIKGAIHKGITGQVSSLVSKKASAFFEQTVAPWAKDRAERYLASNTPGALMVRDVRARAQAAKTAIAAKARDSGLLEKAEGLLGSAGDKLSGAYSSATGAYDRWRADGGNVSDTLRSGLEAVAEAVRERTGMAAATARPQDPLRQSRPGSPATPVAAPEGRQRAAINRTALATLRRIGAARPQPILNEASTAPAPANDAAPVPANTDVGAMYDRVAAAPPPQAVRDAFVDRVSPIATPEGAAASTPGEAPAAEAEPKERLQELLGRMTSVFESLPGRLASAVDRQRARFGATAEAPVTDLSGAGQTQSGPGAGEDPTTAGLAPHIDEFKGEFVRWAVENRKATSEQLKLLQAILETGGTGGGGGGNRPPSWWSQRPNDVSRTRYLMGGLGGLAKRGIMKTLRAPGDLSVAGFKYGAKGAWWATKQYAKFYRTVAKAPMAVAKTVFKRRNEAPFVDVYRRDRLTPGKPLVTAQQLEDGAVTASGKPVANTKGLTEPVMDPRTGKTLITQEDLDAGLVDVNAVPITKRRLKRSIAGALGDTGVAGMKAVGKVGAAFFSPKNPVFGMYASIFGSMAKVIGGTASIFGKGLVGLLSGKAPAALIKGAFGVMKPLAGMYGSLFKMGGTVISAGIRTSAGLLSNMLGFSGRGGGVTKRKDLEEVIGKRLDDIYDLLEARLTATKKATAGDSDGDGDRDNSYADQIQKIKERRQARQTEQAGGGGGSGPGGRGGIMAALGAVGALASSAKAKADAAADNSPGIVESTAGAYLASKVPGVKAAAGAVKNAGLSLGKKALRLGGKGLPAALAAAGAGAATLGSLWPKAAEKVAAEAAAPAAVKTAAEIATKSAAPTAAKAAEAAVKPAAEVATKVGEKFAAEEGLKLAEKTAGKTLAKKVPILGAIAGGAFAADRLMDGDLVGAGGELASGLVSIVPVWGTGLSIAIDGWLGYRDYTKMTDPRSLLIKARMAAYGVEDPKLFDYALAMEKQTVAIIEGRANKLSPVEMASIAKDLGMDGRVADVIEYFNTWYTKKYTRLVLAYLEILNQHGLTYDHQDDLTTDQINLVLNAFLQQTDRFAANYAKLKPTMGAYNEFVKSQKEPATAPVPTAAPAVQQNFTPGANAPTGGDGGQPPPPSGSGPTPPGGAASAQAGQTPTPPPSGGLNGAVPPANAGAAGAIAAAMPPGTTGGGGQAYSGSAPPPAGGNPAAAKKSGKENLRKPTGATPMGVGEDGLGSLSARFESGGQGSMAIGWDDTGGTSYGKYQLSALKGSFGEFVDYAAEQGPEGKVVSERLKKAGPAETGSTRGAVPDEWRKLVTENPELMAKLEHAWVDRYLYNAAIDRLDPPVQQLIKSSKTLRDVMWSTAVQHGQGGAARIFARNYDPKQDIPTYIRKIYEYRATQFGKSKPNIRAGVQDRLRKESVLATGMFQSEQAAGPAKDAAAGAASNPNPAGAPAPTRDGGGDDAGGGSGGGPSDKGTTEGGKGPAAPALGGGGGASLPPTGPTVDATGNTPQLGGGGGGGGPSAAAPAPAAGPSAAGGGAAPPALPAVGGGTAAGPAPAAGGGVSEEALKNAMLAATAPLLQALSGLGSDLKTSLGAGGVLGDIHDSLQANLKKPVSINAPVMAQGGAGRGAGNGLVDLDISKGKPPRYATG